MRYPDPAQCVRLLDCLLRFFGKNGQHWTRFTYDEEARGLAARSERHSALIHADWIVPVQ